MLDNKPITFKELDDIFLAKLFLLAKTYGDRNESFEAVKDFVDFGYVEGQKLSPSDADYSEPFKQ